MILSKMLNFNKHIGRIAVKNILIIKLDAVGDMVYATPVFKLLIQKYPESKLTVFCRESIKSLIKYDPHLSLIITDLNQLKQKYDLVIDLRGNFKTLGFALFNPPTFRLDRGTIRFRNKLKGNHPHELITNVQIIEPIIKVDFKSLQPEIYFSIENERLVKNYLEQNLIGNFAVLHVGASRDLRKWSPLKFAELANYLKNQIQLEIIFVGSSRDIIDIQKVQKEINFKTFNVAGEFSWTAYAALVQKAKLFIGNESGPLHVAAAMQTPLVGLFGPGEPDVFYPFGEKSTFVHHVLPCNPCNQIDCIHLENTCMQRITLTEVIDKINALGF
nr:glycosyltransferase family 9 protein [Pseudopedobacter sp.]